MSKALATKPADRSMKTLGQTRAIFGLAKNRGLSDDELRAVVEEETGSRSISQLTRHDAEKVIHRLGGNSVTPRRTVQHRRQRAGVPQIASASHLDLMRSLASHRGLSDEQLEQLSVRQCGHYPPRTTVATNKVVEALRAMNRRDGLWH